jgi:hypothetical protein
MSVCLPNPAPRAIWFSTHPRRSAGVQARSGAHEGEQRSEMTGSVRGCLRWWDGVSPTSAQVGRTSWPVSRILCPGKAGAATIHLGPPLPVASCGPPGSSGGPPSNAPCLTLLQVGFTEPPGSPRALVVSYTTVSPLPGAVAPGGLLSVALSRGSPRVGVTHHPALWSPDFPRRHREGADAAARPARPGLF